MNNAKVYLVWDDNTLMGVFSTEALAVQFAKRRDSDAREVWLEVWTMDGEEVRELGRVLP